MNGAKVYISQTTTIRCLTSATENLDRSLAKSLTFTITHCKNSRMRKQIVCLTKLIVQFPLWQFTAKVPWGERNDARWLWKKSILQWNFGSDQHWSLDIVLKLRDREIIIKQTGAKDPIISLVKLCCIKTLISDQVPDRLPIILSRSQSPSRSFSLFMSLISTFSFKMYVLR
jgi:hypothetical protein